MRVGRLFGASRARTSKGRERIRICPVRRLSSDQGTGGATLTASPAFSLADSIASSQHFLSPPHFSASCCNRVLIKQAIPTHPTGSCSGVPAAAGTAFRVVTRGALSMNRAAAWSSSSSDSVSSPVVSLPACGRTDLGLGKVRSWGCEASAESGEFGICHLGTIGYQPGDIGQRPSHEA